MHLVVCVDRDDDLGRKAGVAGPVLGREAVLEAATKLGVADPEDSDANAMMAAVGLMDELKAAGDNSEVVVLTGDERVGVISDRKLAAQFDEILKKISVKSLYLVSDGAEDEHIYPILSSRKPIASVRRIYIRQSATLQGTYYTIVRALKDRKLRFKTILPLAAFLLFLGFVESLSLFYGLDIWSYGIIFLLLFIGVYLLIWTFDIDEWILERTQSFASDLRSGSIAVFIGVLAVVLFVLGLFLGDQAFLSAASGSAGLWWIPAAATPSPSYRLFAYFAAALVWWVIAAAIWEVGSAAHKALSTGSIPPSFWVVGVSITAFGIESYELLYLSTSILGIITLGNLLPYILGVVLGIALGAFAGALRQYLQVHTSEPEEATNPT